MAFGVNIQNKEKNLLCPMIDARRMEVYAAVYNQNLEEVLPVEARIIDDESFSDLLQNHKVVFFGDGAMKCRETFSGKVNAVFVDDFLNSARDLSALAYKKFISKEFEDVAYFEPFYLKDFLATQPKAVK